MTTESYSDYLPIKPEYYLSDEELEIRDAIEKVLTRLGDKYLDFYLKQLKGKLLAEMRLRGAEQALEAITTQGQQVLESNRISRKNLDPV